VTDPRPGRGPASVAEGAVGRVGHARPVRSIYVHAPFCARRCPYCDFAVTVERAPRLAPWIEALAAEWAAVEREGLFPVAESLESLYVGGGTPSLLGPDAMHALVRLLDPRRLTSPVLEWTAEANPESFMGAVGREWARAGVNRLSLGVQSFEAKALAWMGRLHGAKGAEEALAVARSVGITNVSIDLMFGLPPGLRRDWSAELDRAVALEPPHVSLYGLTVEARTPLGRAVAEKREAVADEGQYREEYLEAAERLTAAGYEHYEVSNFALPGFRSRHNTAYWIDAPYLGLGNGAHSYQSPVRQWNLRDWADYQASALGGMLPVEDREELSPDAVRLERVWLGLRTAGGLDAGCLGAPGRELWQRWVREGLARPHPSRVQLTAQGWLLLDRLAVAMDETDGLGVKSGGPEAEESQGLPGRHVELGRAHRD
jgi:oxygen-independent coproporphyrinogen-3 oxidase